MGKGRDKVMKTYGRHKNRVIKADFWDAEFNSSIKNIFSDDSDFVDTKLSKNGCKRKKNEDKENKKTKRGKCTQGRKEEADHKLFSEKETTSSFFDFCEGGPLKDLPPKTVPASVRRNHVCNNAKLYFEASQLQIESKEQNTSISFSDFDNYNLCISDSPAGTTTKTECPTLNDSGRLGKGLSPEVFSQITKPFQSTESDKNLESLHQNDTIFRKPQNTGITTSTPLAPITAVSRLQNSRIPDDHSLFEQTQDSQSSISHLMDHDDSVRYSTPMKMNSSQPPKDSLSPAKNNSTDSADLYDCFVHLKKLDQEIENPLNMSDHLGQFVSFRSKEQKTSSRGQLSTDNNNNNNNNSDDEDATENKGSKGCLELFRSIAICANCSFDQPCGDRCAYMDIKLSPDTCSVQLQKLEDIFDNLHKTESPKDLDLDTVDFDAPMNLFESYFHTSHLCHSLEDSNHEDEDMGKVADVVEDRKELDVEKLNQLMSSTLLSVVEEENEEELVGSSSGDEETDEENEEELVGSSSRDEETDEEELVGSSSRDEETDEEELVGSSSRDEETDEEELVGSSSRDEETDEEELVGSSSRDEETDEELVGSSSRDEEELVGSSSRYELVGSSSRVEETDEEELVGSSSRYELVGSSSRVEETDEEELVGSSSRYELVGSSSRVEETDEEELVGSSSRDEETDEELVGSSSRDEETDEEELVGSSSSDEETDEENESGSIHLHVESCGPAECENVKQTRQEVDVRLPLPTRSPYLTRHYTSSICTDADSVCTNVTQSSLLCESLVHSPYMTRHSKVLVVSYDESKDESLPSTPNQDGSGCHSYKEHVEGDDGNFSQVSAVMNVSSPGRRSFIELLSPKISPLSPRTKVLQQCQQDDFISFYDCINYSMMKNCVKIGEGVYGEVFRTKKKGQSVALKIIPIEGDFEVNECPQKDFVEILPEIVISSELSDLRNGIEDNTQNFVLVKSVSCLKGAYPSHLMKEWDIFHKQKRSDNDRPDLFDNNQLFILFEFGDGGSALEHFKFNHLRQAKSVLQQVTYGLAIAESAFEFEHRDLHWGNVLVRPCANETLHYKLKGSDIDLPSWGLEVSIIDFTLSRLQKDGCTVFCDLAKDEVLFEGHGDYQFDVYRLMRAQTENQWERYCPKTNVYWIHYLADKLLKCKKYEEYTREDNEILRSLRQFVREVTDYTSTIKLVTTCPFMMSSV